LARVVCREHRLGPADLVVEAASNDGSVLRAFQRHKVRVLGIEPAANIAREAQERGIPTWAEFFDDHLAGRIVREEGPAHVLLARHVLAHVIDLHGFVRGIKRLLAPEGLAVIEVPHLIPLFRKVEFDTIYHEHLCYFSASVLRTLFERFALTLIDVDRLRIHGGSLLLHVAHRDGPYSVSPRLAGVLRQEEALQLGRLPAWRGFARRVAVIKDQLLALLDHARRDGLRLAGYGAPAKGNTLLCYCGIGPDRLPYLVDKNALKQGTLTPGQHLPVLAPEVLLDEQPDLTLILAWNFANEIVQQQAEYRRRGGTFAVPIPRPRLIGSGAWSKAFR
jgi:hypothetical protein